MTETGEEDYKIADAGSIAKRIDSGEWPLWQKLALFCSIGLILLAIIIIIVVILSNGSGDSNNEDKIDELKVMGEIICQYNIDRGNVKTEILSQDFAKPDSMNIVIDNKIIVGFVREFQFSESGDHKLRFVFYNQKVNLDNMFKDIKSLVSVEMNSTKSLEITSMQSTFEGCENLNNFNIVGYDLSQVKSVQKLFYKANQLKHLSKYYSLKINF